MTPDIQTNDVSPVPENNSFVEDWASAVFLMQQAARTALIDEVRCKGHPKKIQAQSVSRKGRFLSVTPSEDADSIQTAIALSPGTRVKITSHSAPQKDKRAEDRRKEREENPYHSLYSTLYKPHPNHRPPRPKRLVSFASGEVQKVTPSPTDETQTDQPQGPIVHVSLTTRGKIYTALDEGESLTLTIPGKKEPARYWTAMGKVEEQPLLPARSFIQGDFPKIEAKEELQTKEGLDATQNEAYGKALLTKEGGILAHPVLFLHGGPGTGKTSTSCEIIAEHVRQGRRVLVLSESNKGVDVLGRGLQKREIKVHRAGNSAQDVDPKLCPSRIRRGINFPHAVLTRINEMSDEEARKKAKEKGWNGEDMQAFKEEFRKAILLKYEEKLTDCGEKLKANLEQGGVVLATFGTLINDSLLADMSFDVVVIDEATRLKWEELMLALQFPEQQLIMVGDYFQLGNIPVSPAKREQLEKEILLKIWADADVKVDKRSYENHPLPPWKLSNLEIENAPPAFLSSIYSSDEVAEREIRKCVEEIRESLTGTSCESFSTDELIQCCRDLRAKIRATLQAAATAVDMSEQGPFAQMILGSKNPKEELPYVFLKYNRRSLPNIVHVLSELIYDGKLIPGREDPKIGHQGIVRWIDTKDLVQELGKERHAGERTTGTSKKNGLEADIIVTQILERVRKGEKPENIAVIAMYASQAELIRDRLSRKLGGPQYEKLLKKLLPRIGTVDAYQGSESPIVYVSLTRSNAEGSIGFLEEKRRLGVAIGRAANELYVVGDSRTVVDENTDATSKEFFGKLKGLVQQKGKIILEPKRGLDPVARHARQDKRKRWRANRPERQERRERKKQRVVSASNKTFEDAPSNEELLRKARERQEEALYAIYDQFSKDSSNEELMRNAKEQQEEALYAIYNQFSPDDFKW